MRTSRSTVASVVLKSTSPFARPSEVCRTPARAMLWSYPPVRERRWSSDGAWPATTLASRAMGIPTGPGDAGSRPITDKRPAPSPVPMCPKMQKALITKAATLPPRAARIQFLRPWINVTGSADLPGFERRQPSSPDRDNSADESGVWTMTRKANAPRTIKTRPPPIGRRR